MRAPNVYTISPAQPFLATFVERFVAGDLGTGALPADDPLALADARIYVPTQRAARALAAVFRARATGPSVVLPRILPLGALEATEPELLFAEPDLDASGLPLPTAASSVWRRLKLATLIQRWAEAIGGALRSVGRDGVAVIDPEEAFRVATSSADAFALAGDLARLIDEMTIEGVEWRALDDLHMARFDEYWRITTTFLSIAVTQWPAMLAEAGLIDRADRQTRLVAAQARALAEGRSAGPVVAIGSTGSNRATARLLAAIARAPRGAVVLPGLDRDLDDAAWRLVTGPIADGNEPSFGHPQAAMARLLPMLALDRGAVQTLGTIDTIAGVRARFVAEALRPADTTELWRGWRRALAAGDLAASLADVALIEAADEREESLALAVAMREVLETPGRTAALVTPDRELARRVRGELLRWNVEVTDTGGEPLAIRPLGVLARLAAAAAATGAARDVAALLAHPLAAPGRPRHEAARLAAKLEIAVLRAVPLGGKSAADLFAKAKTFAADRHAHPAQKSLRDGDWADMAALWDALAAALAPLIALRRGAHPPATWAGAHRLAVAALVGDGAVAADEAHALDAVLDELLPETDGLLFDAEGYGLFFGRLANEYALQNTEHPHPRLQILGLIEARLITADVMLLGGLDETVWPPAPQSDPFLNRPMRDALGLTPPERRIGQTAHDFTQAMGANIVVLSRAKKRGGAPAVASRFLLRMEALAGKVWEPVRTRGERLLGLARNLDRPLADPVAAKRPVPRPPVELRPTQLSVTAIETLRRDPYAIHAARILRLQPLPSVEEEVGAGEYGSLMHAALREFVGHSDASGTNAARQAALEAILRETFAAALADPVFKTFRWPVMRKTMTVFLAFDSAQRAKGGTIAVELDGRLAVPLADLSPFLLTARADRLDRHADGSATLVDYKTGTPPGNKEVQVGFAPQLTLEAAMLREGAFGETPTAEMAATYVKLGGKDGGFVRSLDFEGESFADCVERHFAGLKQLLSAFRELKTPYPSRPFPKYARASGDYDHLARVREWSLAGDEEAVP